MKVVYIPVVLPIIKRTLVSLALLIISILLLTIGLSIGRWTNVSYNRVEGEVPEDQLPDGSIVSLNIMQGLQYVDLRTCYHVIDFIEPMCVTRSVVYSFCKEKDVWCAGKVKFFVTLVCFIIAIVGGIVAFFVAFLNEKVAGPVALVGNLLFGIIGTVFFLTAEPEIHEKIFGQFTPEMTVMKKIVNTDISFHLCLSGICVGILAGILCSTVICYSSKSYSERVRESIQVVTMDIGGATSIPVNASRVGFVRMGGNRGMNSELYNFGIDHGDFEDDTELDLITNINTTIRKDRKEGEQGQQNSQQQSPMTLVESNEAVIPHSSSNNGLLASSTSPLRLGSMPMSTVVGEQSVITPQSAPILNSAVTATHVTVTDNIKNGGDDVVESIEE